MIARGCSLRRNKNGDHTSMHDLIRLAQHGDAGAFAELMAIHGVLAMRVSVQILHSEDAAEDAMQDAMLKVWKALPAYWEGNFRSWFLRIVTNTCYDHLKREKRKPTLSLDELIEDSTYGDGGDILDADTPDMLASVIQQEGVEMILTQIDTLPEWHRTSVLLVDVDGLAYDEAAQTLGVPIGTIKSRVSRARAALRERIER